ncbi:hypothetical protein Q3G72_022051 [Acer saccharum]|nr:hypothetical protein Q3G72_022051 [Acer saccharum]
MTTKETTKKEMETTKKETKTTAEGDDDEDGDEDRDDDDDEGCDGRRRRKVRNTNGQNPVSAAPVSNRNGRNLVRWFRLVTIIAEKPGSD